MSKTLVVVGQGYVGLPLSREAVASGLRVRGLDLDGRIVDSLNQSISHVDDISSADLASMVCQGYQATTSPLAIAEADYVVICVPTPLSQDNSPDLGAVKAAARSIAAHLRKGAVIVLESTTYPGTTDQLVKGILDDAGHRIDEDYFLAFSPERIDPGNSVHGLRNTPKVVGGVTAASTRKAVELYSRFIDSVVEVPGAREAETAKLLENTYRHVNIALVNEMAKFCHEMGIDLWSVIDAARTKPFGFEAFYPGPGVGGHCIPIDPNYLSYEVKRSLGYPFRFVELAQEINQSMPRYVVGRLQDLLNERGKPLRGADVLLLGVTYKANIADQRESPAAPLAEVLRLKGARVAFHDPHVDQWRLGDATLRRVADLDSAASASDAVLLLQRHRDYDVEHLAAISPLLFDTRGAASRNSRAVRL
ncbi:nucleotide sugar dehydrogenase [Sinomonas sp. JGH33]|uniref:Nucleotide sugar dehydrogenase n=1 Tax=Sinomonas terricola TaxID=3110330 RepID=A0ABU5T154_9MICC|nr:nucleotide sugar dehydrogenase [Sinomonas sp. JGH33]MEA5453391.1 nucleotide sugar dehydrogenase [Sinomonas sp. JGH33]